MIAFFVLISLFKLVNAPKDTDKKEEKEKDDMEIFRTLIFALSLLVVNLILIYKPIPVLAFPVMLFTLYLYITQFLGDSSLPVQPYFTIFLILINVSGLIVNALSLKGK